jgi:hypothetical protein
VEEALELWRRQEGIGLQLKTLTETLPQHLQEQLGRCHPQLGRALLQLWHSLKPGLPGPAEEFGPEDRLVLARQLSWQDFMGTLTPPELLALGWLLGCCCDPTGSSWDGLRVSQAAS